VTCKETRLSSNEEAYEACGINIYQDILDMMHDAGKYSALQSVSVPRHLPEPEIPYFPRSLRQCATHCESVAEVLSMNIVGTMRGTIEFKASLQPQTAGRRDMSGQRRRSSWSETEKNIQCDAPVAAASSCQPRRWIWASLDKVRRGHRALARR
jgi:hypothetical protein